MNQTFCRSRAYLITSLHSKVIVKTVWGHFQSSRVDTELCRASYTSRVDDLHRF